MDSLARHLIENALEIRQISFALLALAFIGAAYFFTLLDAFFDQRQATRKARKYASSKAVTAAA